MQTVISRGALAIALVSAAVTATPALALTAPDAPPTAADADAFVKQAEAELFADSLSASKVYWVNATYITEDTDAMAAEAGERSAKLWTRLASEAAKYKDVAGLSAETRRKLTMLATSQVLPAPSREGAAGELATIATRLSSTYGKGKGTLRGQPISGSDIEAEMGTNRNPAELAEMWTS